AAVIDHPAIEARDAELDIVADRRKTLPFLDQIPDGAVVTGGQRDGSAAIAPPDRPIVAGGKVAMLMDAGEVGYGHLRQVRHIAYLMIEPLGDLAAHPGLRADAGNAIIDIARKVSRKNRR